MCGRYYVDDDTAREIEKLVRKLDYKRLKQVQYKPVAGKYDVNPGNNSRVIYRKNNEPGLDIMQWGFPGINGKGIIFNARSESVMQKRMFSSSILYRRCIVPAKGFYEWDSTGNKVTFVRRDRKLLLLAGIWKPYEKNRFVILTAKANTSISMVHDRIPLIVEEDEAEKWIMEDKQFTTVVNHENTLLDISDGFVQQNLFNN